MPEVSVILPTHNGERYIRQSIDSIRNQTYKDWELIIVNDGSTDRTPEIIREYVRLDGRIRMIENRENRRLPGALNRGFAEAAGNFLTWTSDDNIYLPDAIEVMYTRLKEQKELYMVCADMQCIDGSGEITGNAEPYNEDRICENNLVGACFMYRNTVIKEVGEYDEEMVLVEDYDYWLRIRLRYGRIERIPMILYQYRFHEGSLSERKRRAVEAQRMKLREKYIDYITEQLSGKKASLCRIYYEFLENGHDMQAIGEKIFQKIPALKWETCCRPGQNGFIIFGAGNFGIRAAKILRERAAFFADNDKSKAGLFQCGLRILSFDEMQRYASDYCILIAVSVEKICDMAQQLVENKILNFCTFRYFMLKKEDRFMLKDTNSQV